MIALICPLCRQPLSPNDHGVRCSQGHTFDRAREGYFNLLPIQHKKSRAPGDNHPMIRARRDFLAAGHYAPLRDTIADLLHSWHTETLLDVGCGEGWYTAALTRSAREVIGLDIAKEAARLAAKQTPSATWLVASSAALPLADESVDVITSLFSPVSINEAVRILRPGGRLLLVTPGETHLRMLRERLFDEVRPHQPDKFVAGLAPRFTLETRQELTFPLSLDRKSLADLLMMTPYAWRALREKREALLALAHANDNAHFVLMTFVRS